MNDPTGGSKIVKHCRIGKPEKFKLSDFDPAECFGLSTDVEKVRAILADGVAPEKRWKFSAADIAERAYWDDYMAAYEEIDPRNLDGLCSLVRHSGGPQAYRLGDRLRRRSSRRSKCSSPVFRRSAVRG